ncbi:MAG: hypothetical protein VXX66_10700, partial [Actinomycetota bacterium]|nr:hypothetical protein [Actinomycetota bacterium]
PWAIDVDAVMIIAPPATTESAHSFLNENIPETVVPACFSKVTGVQKVSYAAQNPAKPTVCANSRNSQWHTNAGEHLPAVRARICVGANAAYRPASVARKYEASQKTRKRVPEAQLGAAKSQPLLRFLNFGPAPHI